MCRLVLGHWLPYACVSCSRPLACFCEDFLKEARWARPQGFRFHHETVDVCLAPGPLRFCEKDDGLQGRHLPRVSPGQGALGQTVPTLGHWGGETRRETKFNTPLDGIGNPKGALETDAPEDVETS